MPKVNPSRAAKQIGDFGEALVNYDFIRKGYEVAVVDHVGADLICSKDGTDGTKKRYAISVKTRRFKNASDESRMYNIESAHLDKLRYFSDSFGLEPLFSLLVCISDDKKLILFTVRVVDIPSCFRKTKAGYSFRFSDKHLVSLKNDPNISISLWENEVIGNDIFA
ncbi:MAG: hypothetical protein Q9M16_10180 [Mariprofundus sp.]|nr:hypothetical protein [Mariprofundus sp.]